MRNTKPIVYMDACCFIDAVKSAAGFPVDGRVGDVWHIKKLFEAHRAGDITVQTSMLSLAECVAVESGQADVPPAAQTEIKRLLMSGQFVTLATMTPKTARITQDFRWKHKLVLKGCDALHVATAIEIGAREFISTDERLRKPRMKAVAECFEPTGLRFIRAADTQLIPDSLRQGDLEDA